MYYIHIFGITHFFKCFLNRMTIGGVLRHDNPGSDHKQVRGRITLGSKASFVNLYQILRKGF